MNRKRDCKNCIHKVPVFDEEEGIWRGADCDAWECNFVSRAEALKAYEGRPQGEWKETELTEEYRRYGFDIRIVCSRCGSENSYFTFNEYHEPVAVTFVRSRYCPYCGAKMIRDFTGEAIP